MSEIFISYSRKDEQFVARLVTDLEREGRDLYYDRKLKAAQDFNRVLPRQLEFAKFVLVAVSQNSLASQNVAREVRNALHRESDGLTTVVPLLIQPVDPQAFTALFGSKVYADFSADYQRGMAELTATIGNIQSQLSTDTGKKQKSKAALSAGKVAMITAALGAAVSLIIGYWQFVYKLPPKDPPVIQYAGRVVDASTQQVITGAKVSVDTQGVPQVYYSDSDGVFYLQLPHSVQSARIRVEANGYEAFDRIVSPSRTGTEEVRLLPARKSSPLKQSSPARKQGSKSSESQINRILSAEPSNRPD